MGHQHQAVFLLVVNSSSTNSACVRSRQVAENNKSELVVRCHGNMIPFIVYWCLCSSDEHDGNLLVCVLFSVQLCGLARILSHDGDPVQRP